MSQSDQVPTPEYIIAQLKAIEKVHPSSRLYRRLLTAPWKKPSTARITWFARTLPLHTRLSALAFTIVVAIGIVLIAPMLKTFAQDILQFFNREESDTIEFTYTPQPITIPSSEIYRDNAHPLGRNPGDIQSYGPYSLSIEEAESIAGFEIHVPSILPDDFRFLGAKASEGFVTMRFETLSALPYTKTFELVLWQDTDGEKTHLKIGETADIQSVQIGDIVGEYVKGRWSFAASNDIREQQLSGIITETYNWQDKGRAALSWQQDEVFYTLIALHPMSRDNMIGIAKCMQADWVFHEPTYDLVGYRKLFKFKDIDCAIDHQVVTQTYLMTGQFLIFRQQPINSENSLTSSVEIAAESRVTFTTLGGESVDGIIFEGTWMGNSPSELVGQFLPNARGVMLQSETQQYELWAVGEGRSWSHISIEQLIEIAKSIE